MTTHSLEVPADLLRAVCPPEDLPFETTETVASVQGTVGQERALAALQFGLESASRGYNLFVAGVPGSGRSTTAFSHVQRQAERQPTPDDWCYVYNFADPYRPRSLRVPPGFGPALAKDMDGLVDRAKRDLPRAFDTEAYQQQRQRITVEFERQRAALFEALEHQANALGFAIQLGPAGIMTIPMIDGKPLTPDEYQALPQEERHAMRERGETLNDPMMENVRQVHEAEHHTTEQLQELDRETALFAVGHLVEGLIAKYSQYPEVVAYLGAVRDDMVQHLDRFRSGGDAQRQGFQGGPSSPTDDPFVHYRVNVVVSRDASQGAPVVCERNPTYYNLVGRVDYRPSFGTMSTDFRMIKAGALHRANGGYLILEAHDVLLNPMAWEALKRALDTREAVIENLGEMLSAVPTLTLRPEPIPLEVKVVLVGTAQVHDLLYLMDEEFRNLFKVKADFDNEMERTPETIAIYAGFVRARVEQEKLLHFDRTGVAKVVEFGSRLREHQHRLSTRFVDITDLISEASHWAVQDKSGYVTADHVRRAIEQKDFRASQSRDKVQRAIREGVIDIATDGRAVGRVNGLSVLQTADYIFGIPSRISARVAPGSAGVVNVEREIEMSGRVHSKGVMILSGYLGGKYARDLPLSLAASLTFEQLYNEVDGDSASGAELCCLLSALADVPINQGIAMTGSVNQNGEIQAVGGVQYKIEGFFDTCRAKGLTGNQGVLIPATNVPHLMLREDVVDAVRNGQFHVYAVSHVEEALELLTGLPAGAEQPNGKYPSDSLNDRIQRRLRHYADQLSLFRGGSVSANHKAGEPSPL